jgi:hypothetical protein
MRRRRRRSSCHARESGHPVIPARPHRERRGYWVPACAGTTIDPRPSRFNCQTAPPSLSQRALANTSPPVLFVKAPGTPLFPLSLEPIEGVARQPALQFSCVSTLIAQDAAPLGAPRRRLIHCRAALLAAIGLPEQPGDPTPFGALNRRASGKANGSPSASSSQEVLVPPGGDRHRPGAKAALPSPAGAASDPAGTTPHDSALDRTGRHWVYIQ